MKMRIEEVENAGLGLGLMVGKEGVAVGVMGITIENLRKK